MKRARLACPGCGRPNLHSRALGACADCIRDSDESLRTIDELRALLRKRFALPPNIPDTPNGTICGSCGNECRLGENEFGFCGTKQNRDGALVTVVGSRATGCLSWYHDPLPTNCVASWVCPEREGCASPGTVNLAVFYSSCTFDCLFCQNWHFRETTPTRVSLTAHELCRQGMSREVRCVCFFGGDPGSQIEHAIAAGRA